MLIRHPREMRYHEEDTGQPTPEAIAAPVMDAPASDTAAELERTRKALKDANAESAKRRKRLEELEAAEAERAAANLSEAEKLTAELAKATARADAAQARLDAELIKGAAANAAVALQTPFASADALADAVSLGAFSSLAIGDDGAIPGMNEAIKQLAKQRPYLFGTAQPQAPDINAGARGNGHGPGTTDEQRQLVEKRLARTF